MKTKSKIVESIGEFITILAIFALLFAGSAIIGNDAGPQPETWAVGQ